MHAPHLYRSRFAVQMGLLEISSPDFLGERLVACRNPELARMRSHTRDYLLLATERNLEKIKVRVDAGRLAGKDKIGVAVGKVVNQYKVVQHFHWGNSVFWRRNSRLRLYTHGLMGDGKVALKN